jgi:hypothetical protein
MRGFFPFDFAQGRNDNLESYANYFRLRTLEVAQGFGWFRLGRGGSGENVSEVGLRIGVGDGFGVSRFFQGPADQVTRAQADGE